MKVSRIVLALIVIGLGSFMLFTENATPLPYLIVLLCVLMVIRILERYKYKKEKLT